MKTMEQKKVDVFKASELMIGDLIEIDEAVCEIIGLQETDDGHIISYIDEFGEKEFIEVDDDAEFDIYVLVD